MFKQTLMRFYYRLRIFELLFDIHTIVGVPKMLKTAENSSKTVEFLTDFWLLSAFSEPLLLCKSQKVIQKITKK